MRTIDVKDMQRGFAAFAESVYRGGEPCFVARDGVTVAVLLGAVDFFNMLEAFIACRQAEEADVGAIN